MRRFREFVEREDFEALKKAVLNALGATDDGVDEPLSSFKKSRDLLDQPNIQKLFRQAGNQEAIASAVKNADVTKLSVADLLALFRAGSERKTEIDAAKKDDKKRPAPPMPPPAPQQDAPPPPDQGGAPPPPMPTGNKGKNKGNAPPPPPPPDSKGRGKGSPKPQGKPHGKPKDLAGFA